MCEPLISFIELEKQFILLNIFTKLRNKTTEDTKREKQTVSHAIWIECSFEMCDTAEGEKCMENWNSELTS